MANLFKVVGVEKVPCSGVEGMLNPPAQPMIEVDTYGEHRVYCPHAIRVELRLVDRKKQYRCCPGGKKLENAPPCIYDTTFASD